MSALSLIARNGHVYQPQLNPFEHSKNEGRLSLHLTGIQNASTFAGFCKTHDHELFERIDRPGFGLDEQAIFALHYRALCKELSAKLPSTKSDELLRMGDRGLPEPVQQVLHEALDWRDGVRNLSLRELQEDKRVMDEALLAKNYAEVQSCVLRFKCKPIAACAGYVQPVFDFSGEVLQDFNNLEVRVYSQAFSILPTADGQTVVLSWHTTGAPYCKPFAQSLLDVADSRKSTAVLLYLFNGFENYALNPDWWESVDAERLEIIEEQMQEWLGPTPFFDSVDPNALRPGSVDLANWELVEARMS